MRIIFHGLCCAGPAQSRITIPRWVFRRLLALPLPVPRWVFRRPLALPLDLVIPQRGVVFTNRIP